MPPGARFCPQCGGRYRPTPAQAPLGPRYSGLRFQVDPIYPPPRRDIRWVLIVLGISFLVVGILFLAVAALVSGAVSAGCGSPTCSNVDPGPWFDWVGLPFLGLGVAFLVTGLWWALR